MMTAESMLSKRPVLRLTVALFFLLNQYDILHSSSLRDVGDVCVVAMLAPDLAKTRFDRCYSGFLLTQDKCINGKAKEK